VLLCVLFLCVTPCNSRTQNTLSECDLEITQSFQDYEYFMDGDIVIGGVFT
ncbi:Hypothetical predicted protein, partial [Pelobates cultripes]